ncbi:peptidase S8/S53 domain-containing protein [Chlamydoabsidia padenii]|nr:peptidase S8/S53 domain-containing protein [Chlamydoabsidia padenii]
MDWQLEPIQIGSKFIAMTGVFHDTHFLDYLGAKVKYVEPNQYYQTDRVVPTVDLHVSPSPDWGLARISHRSISDLSSYSYHENAGHGVDVYVLDSGININHSDFQGRATREISFVSTETDDDLGGHGTHVAGKIGGRQFGVAKGARIHAVKILDKSGVGTTNALIQALSHIIDVAIPGKSIINLSLSGPTSQILDEVLEEATEVHNIPIFVSAGNLGSDACLFSPSSSPHVFTVGATDIQDRVASYSDTGKCVSLYAPGSQIKSAWIGSDDASQVLDGTSMASPHVSGIAAILMSEHTFNSVHDLYNTLRSLATRDVLTFDGNITSIDNNNLLAFYSADQSLQ